MCACVCVCMHVCMYVCYVIMYAFTQVDSNLGSHVACWLRMVDDPVAVIHAHKLHQLRHLTPTIRMASDLFLALTRCRYAR